MKKLYFLMTSVVLCALSTIGNAQETKGAAFREFTGKEVETQKVEFYTAPLMVDLDIAEKKITFTQTYNNVWEPPVVSQKARRGQSRRARIQADSARAEMERKSEKAFREAINMLKANALYDASLQNGVDVIAVPSYSITSENGRDYTITVTGYPARYRNFRELTPADRELLEGYKYGRKDPEVKAVEPAFYVIPNPKLQ